MCGSAQTYHSAQLTVPAHKTRGNTNMTNKYPLGIDTEGLEDFTVGQPKNLLYKQVAERRHIPGQLLRALCPRRRRLAPAVSLAEYPNKRRRVLQFRLR